MMTDVCVYIDNIFFKENVASFYGHYLKKEHALDHLYFKTDTDEDIPFNYYAIPDKVKNNCYQDVQDEKNVLGFKVDVDLSRYTSLKLMGVVNNQSYPITANFGKYCYFNNKFFKLYLRSQDYYLLTDAKSFTIVKKSFVNGIKEEMRCILGLIRYHKLKSLIYREVANLYHLFKRKEIWIISDRIEVGEDNGQAFFEYMNTFRHPKIKVYFAIQKGTNDYYKLKKYRGVINHNSFRHRILYLNADCIISSQVSPYITNLFNHGKNYLADLYRFKLIFLQHGITKDDISSWINVNFHPIDMFVTSANLEYASLTDGKYLYNYPKDTIKLTGMARYDKLLDQDRPLKKQIILMPTWRKNLSVRVSAMTTTRKYNDHFKETDYFKFYNALINDKKLLQTLKKYRYRFEFIPHINMREQIKDFDTNGVVEIVSDDVIYSDKFKESSLLVTDYSSVAFDFAYLKKPIIYTQFDQDTFYQGQIYSKGYFDYESDGFGQITKTVAEARDAIIKAIIDDCKIEPKYLERIDNFYKYHDQNNCKRIYEEIQKL